MGLGFSAGQPVGSQLCAPADPPPFPQRLGRQGGQQQIHRLAEEAEAAVDAVGGDQEGIAPEQLQDGALVVAEVVVEGYACRHTGRLELAHHQGTPLTKQTRSGMQG